jgi:hypothetical protein
MTGISEVSASFRLAPPVYGIVPGLKPEVVLVRYWAIFIICYYRRGSSHAHYVRKAKYKLYNYKIFFLSLLSFIQFEEQSI